MANRRKPHAEKTCPVCGKVFDVPPSLADMVTCSRKCKGIASRGPRTLIEKVCARCGQPFSVRPFETKRQYCSRVCANTAKKQSVATIVCLHCRQEFQDQPYCHRKYCSKDCQLQHMRRKIRECLWCGKNYKPSKHHNQYCSNQCRYAVHSLLRGPLNKNWRGGSVKYGPNWREQRRQALQRDGHSCQVCGDKTNLHVHHIIPARTFRGDWNAANALSNLIVLCHPCHKQVEFGNMSLNLPVLKVATAVYPALCKVA